MKLKPKKKRYKRLHQHTLDLSRDGIYISRIMNNGEKIILAGHKINPSLHKIDGVINLIHINGNLSIYRILEIRKSISNPGQYVLICKHELKKLEIDSATIGLSNYNDTSITKELS